MGNVGTATRILIVDDQEANVALLTALLKQAGYRDLVSTTDSRQAIPLVAEHDPDLVLLDLHMPAPDGMEVMSELAPWTAGKTYLPILVLTADASAETKRQALAAGARDFLTKPFDAAEVVLRVRNMLETRRLQRSLETQNEALELRVQERTAQLERSRLETLERLARASEFRDDDTYQHALRIGRTSALLAQARGLDDETVTLMRQAAPLHDVGKIAIPDSILLKPGKLDEDEFEVMKGHAEAGAQILAGSESDVLRAAEQIAVSHHERWDGTGYPAGLGGGEIPLSGRIVALADVFDALTHERPYKEAWPVDRAVAEIQASAGTQFDPHVVDVFANLDHEALLEHTMPASTPLAEAA